jgi:DegV family protein with EDD domain
MSKVTILTDSTAYLPTELIHQLDISIIPLFLIWGESSFLDGVEMTPREFYNRMANSKIAPTTSQPTPTAMMEKFNELIETGNDVLGIFISSKLSGTVESAIQGREMMTKGKEKISIVDSLATTMAMGWPVLTAARAAKAGEQLAGCHRAAVDARDHTNVLFVVETLEYLKRGGRIGGAQAFLGTLLQLKPLLELQEGKIEAVERIRTKDKALEKMLDLVEEKISGRSPVRLATVHANTEQEAKSLLENARERFKPVESFTSPLSPVIGAHAGPGTVALAFMVGI